MSSSTRVRSNRRGVSSHDDTPQVVVRAGKTFLCTACGTLVEIPADVVGQYVLVAPSKASPPEATSSRNTASDTAQCDTAQCDTAQCDTAQCNTAPPKTMPDRSLSEPSPPQEEPTGSPAAAEGPGSAGDQGPSASPNNIHREHFDARRAPAATGRTTNAAAKHPLDKRYPPKPRRADRPPRPVWTGQTIDGLVVPSARQFDQAFAWVSYQLKVLDQKHALKKQLEKELRAHRAKAPRGPCPVPGAKQPSSQQHAPKPPPETATSEAPLRAVDGNGTTARSIPKRGPP